MCGVCLRQSAGEGHHHVLLSPSREGVRYHLHPPSPPTYTCKASCLLQDCRGEQRTVSIFFNVIAIIGFMTSHRHIPLVLL